MTKQTYDALLKTFVHPHDDILIAFINGTLPSRQETESTAHHISICACCRESYEFLQSEHVQTQGD